ncbi:MAG: hypothetical protein C3F18_05770 [Nitrosomonadales bacterium]|nr:MAG: hypothetical protein C3F18_05770 [Nitrosomonadales bacterium]
MGLIRRVLGHYLKQKPIQLHQAEIDTAIEQLLYEINPRLRFLPGYRETLSRPVWNTLKHIHHVIGGIAGPVDAATRQWNLTPALRALFASRSDMEKLFHRDPSLRNCSATAQSGQPASCHAMIAATMQVRKVLGIALRGGIMQREVPQTQISFTDHRIVAAAGSESGLREKLKAFALEFVAHKVLANIAAARSECEGMEQELALLRARMRMKLRQDNGKACLCDRVEYGDGEMAEICTLIKEKEALLSQTAIHQPTLQYFMDQLLLVLNSVGKLLQVHEISLHLDNMNILLDAPEAGAVKPVELTEVLRAGHSARIMLIARVPLDEVLVHDDMAARIDHALKQL